MTKRLVVIPIEAQGRYCCPECSGLVQDGAYCRLFSETLMLDYRRDKFHRIKRCRDAEVKS